MAFERRWPAVPPRQLTSDGGNLGQIQISDTRGFKVGMRANLVAVGQPNLQVQIKRVLSDTLLLVGPVGSAYSKAEWTNAQAYTTAAGAYIFAEEQEKTKVPANDRDEATFDAEPTVAWRNVLVDQLGRYYETANPLPVRLSEGSINIDSLNADLHVQLNDKESTPGAEDYDIVRVGDGEDQLVVNRDGSINVNVVVSSTDGPGLGIQYGEALAVPAGIETTVLTVVAPVDFKRIQKIDVAGSNVSEIRLKLDGQTFMKKYLWHGAFNTDFRFEVFVNGFKLLPGQTLTVTAIHERPSAGDFNATAFFV